QIMPRRRSYERLSPPLLHESRRRSVGGNDAERITFTQRGDAELGSTNLYRIRQHGLKHRLKFAGGTRDNSQHLRGRGLLLQCLAEFVRALVLFFEERHVLDGYYSLVREGLEQGDLPLAEEASLGTAEHDRADRGTFSHQGDTEDRAVALTPRVLARVGKLVPLGLYISDVDGPPVQHRSTTDRAADEWKEGRGTGLMDRAVMGDKK